jgi:WD40 repeat protein
MLLAAGSQDGQAHIWDVRGASNNGSSIKPLATYKGSQALPKGAIRNVKFSQSGSVDLLAFTEHTSFLNLVDARLIGCGEGLSEAVRVSPVDADVNLAGMAFSPHGKSIVVATENAALEYLTDLRARHSFPSGSVL